MEKKNIDWGNLSFGYVQTDYRYVSNFKDGAWDAGVLSTESTEVVTEARDFRGNLLCPGMTYFENELGGKVCELGHRGYCHTHYAAQHNGIGQQYDHRVEHHTHNRDGAEGGTHHGQRDERGRQPRLLLV